MNILIVTGDIWPVVVNQISIIHILIFNFLVIHFSIIRNSCESKSKHQNPQSEKCKKYPENVNMKRYYGQQSPLTPVPVSSL